MASNLRAFLLLVAMPLVTSSFLLLVVRPGAPSSVLAPSSDGLQPSRAHTSQISSNHPPTCLQRQRQRALSVNDVEIGLPYSGFRPTDFYT